MGSPRHRTDAKNAPSGMTFPGRVLLPENMIMDLAEQGDLPFTPMHANPEHRDRGFKKGYDPRRCR